MLTEDAIREVALERLGAMTQNCNAGHRDHNDGVLRGLIWVLTGSDPGTHLTADTEHVFTLLGIQCERRGDKVEYTYK